MAISNRDRPLNVRLAAEQLDAVRLAADAAGLSRGEWVRRAIEAALQRGAPESALEALERRVFAIEAIHGLCMTEPVTLPPLRSLERRRSGTGD